MEDINQQVVNEAVEWIGTPYKHQARVKHKGVDCIGLIIAIYEKITDKKILYVPPYTNSWRANNNINEYMAHYLQKCHTKEIKKGRVVTFEIRKGKGPRHCGIIINDDEFVHAYYGYHVCKSFLNYWWKERINSVFEIK